MVAPRGSSVWTDALMFALRAEDQSSSGTVTVDRGGVTRWGISQRFLQDLHPQQTPAQIEARIRAMTVQEARGLYEQHFWRAPRIGELPPGLAFLTFDMAVNQGRSAAVKLLQRSINATINTAQLGVDGVVGPATVTTTRRLLVGQIDAVLDEMAARRNKRYAETIDFATYGLGWLRRAARAHRAACEVNDVYGAHQ